MLDAQAGQKLVTNKAQGSFNLASIFKIRELNVLLALLVVGALISLATPYFLRTDNLMGVFRSFSLIAIMSIGMVMVIITGGIDLSVGSVHGASPRWSRRFGFQHGAADLRSASSAGCCPACCSACSTALLITGDPAAALHRDAGLAQHRPRR